MLHKVECYATSLLDLQLPIAQPKIWTAGQGSRMQVDIGFLPRLRMRDAPAAADFL